MDRNIGIDYLKSISIILVIIQHTITYELINKIGGAYYILQAVSIFIIISSINLANSFERNEYTIKHIYSKKYFIKKMKRILIPFSIIWVIEILITILQGNYNKISLGKSYITGGFGPGSYFTPIMLQIFFIAPIMYHIAKKNIKVLLGITFIINLIFEIFSHYYLDNSMYRLILLRYLFLISLGLYLVLYNKKSKIIIKFLCFLSMIYIAEIHYFNFKPPVFLAWDSRNVPSFFYPMVLVIIGLTYLNNIKSEKVTNCIILISNSTYHICLIQMLYFWININKKINTQGKDVFNALINVIICVLIGVIFYKFEKVINNNIYKLFTKLSTDSSKAFIE